MVLFTLTNRLPTAINVIEKILAERLTAFSIATTIAVVYVCQGEANRALPASRLCTGL